MISFSLVRIYGTSNVLGREDIQSAEIFTSALKMSGSLLLTLNKGTANKHQNEKKKNANTISDWCCICRILKSI